MKEIYGITSCTQKQLHSHDLTLSKQLFTFPSTFKSLQFECIGTLFGSIMLMLRVNCFSCTFTNPRAVVTAKLTPLEVCLGESKNWFAILKQILRSFQKSKSRFLIWWLFFSKKLFTGFEIPRMQIQINFIHVNSQPALFHSQSTEYKDGCQQIIPLSLC